MADVIITFDSLDRGVWIKHISDTVLSYSDVGKDDKVILSFNQIADIQGFESIHLVTLACLIEFFHKKGCVVSLSGRNTPVGKFLFDTLQFRSYWAGGRNYVPSKDETIFNLWRIIETEKETYSQQVYDYFKQKRFRNKDLSAVKNSLVEVYYNVFDHAEADGNAFSLIKFDENSKKLFVAVCDFGKGIAKTVRDKLPEIKDDADAIMKAMEDAFTIGSRSYNRGLGLRNILSACREDDTLRIISNNGFLYAKNDDLKVRPNNFNFNGTLIYYELSLSHFEDEHIMNNFDLNF